MKHLFIISYGRSGSTLLQRLLNSADGVCIRGENFDSVLHFARSWASISMDPEFKNLKNSTTVPFDRNPWFGINLVDTDSLGRSLAKTFTEEILKPPVGTEVCGFKEIRWIYDLDHFDTRLEFITRFFPDSKFIINTRNLYDVIKSGWWASYKPENALKELSAFEDLAIDWMSRNKSICYHVKYDSYIKNVDALKDVFDFAGIGFDEAVIKRILSERLTH